MHGYFISFEGLDYCGKSTQLTKVDTYLQERGISTLITREPGGTSLGGVLRRVLKNPSSMYGVCNIAFRNNPDFQPLQLDQTRTPVAELLLFLAARAEFVQHIVRPALVRGKTVLSDRCLDSTVAYQGYGLFKGDEGKLALIDGVNAQAMDGTMPTQTFWLDIPPGVMAERAQVRGSAADIFEERGVDFFTRVRAGYEYAHERGDGRIMKIDGTQSIDDIFTRSIRPVLDELYGFD